LLIIYLSSSKGTKSMLSNFGLNVCPTKSSSIESLGGPIVNHLATPQKTTSKKHSYDFSQIFQVLCASKLSWIKLCVRIWWCVHTMKWEIWYDLKHKHKLLTPKWDSLQKYVGQRKVERPLKGGKKGEWYISKDLLPGGGKGIPLNMLQRGES
jgi:hypothetical protein